MHDNKPQGKGNRMPLNSFDQFPMSWKPDRTSLTSPYYESIAETLEQAIVSGDLAPDTRLPPQRELADYLDLNLSTVTRAYKRCERRGLIYAVVGRGSFVSRNVDAKNVLIRNGRAVRTIEMGTVEPFYCTNGTVLETARKVLKKPSAVRLFEYSHPWDNRFHLRAAQTCLAGFGVETAPDNILITPGAQNAFAVLLISLFRSGDKIAVDPYTYPNFIGLANQLQIELLPVRGDEKGMLPDELDRTCRLSGVKGVYLMPSFANPTGITLEAERRKALAETIGRNRLMLIEDDTFAFLEPRREKPIRALIPDRTFYVCGTSKALGAGLRVAFTAFPESTRRLLVAGDHGINLRNAPLNMEIVAEMIHDGTADVVMKEKRRLARRRNGIFRKCFPDASVRAESFFQWLPMPDGVNAEVIEAEALEQGVRVLCSRNFVVGGESRTFLRIATSSPASAEELERGLRILRELVERRKNRGFDRETII